MLKCKHFTYSHDNDVCVGKALCALKQNQSKFSLFGLNTKYLTTYFIFFKDDI